MSELHFLKSADRQFRFYKSLGEGAMEQLSEDGLFWQPNRESNSIAVIVRHLHGNMLSRWTNLLTEDGEKPWRNRDSEFEQDLNSKLELLQLWKQGWDCLFNALENLTEADLGRIIYIRNEGHTVLEAINRQLAHYPYHVGQMVYIAKQLKDTDWKTLSIARNRSSDYNRQKFEAEKGIRHFTEDFLDRKQER